MKKNAYNAPTMEILEAEVDQLLVASPQYDGTTEETSGNLAPEFDGDFDD